MYIIYFSWWKDFRVPPTTTKVKVATAGKTFGVWNDKTNIFKFKLPLVVCTADVAFMGTLGIHEFHFTLECAEVSHVAWEHMDYEHISDAFFVGVCLQLPQKASPNSGAAITQSGRIFQIPQSYQTIPPGRRSVGEAPKIIFLKRNKVCSSYGLRAEPCLFYNKRKFHK